MTETDKHHPSLPESKINCSRKKFYVTGPRCQFDEHWGQTWARHLSVTWSRFVEQKLILAPALGITKFAIVRDMILSLLCCAT